MPSGSSRRRRFPSSVYDRGAEPDARFSLANERTFLAWMGAALALLSVGVGLDTLATNLNDGMRKTTAVVLIIDSIACCAQAWLGWARTERALREGRPLPGPGVSLWLTITISGVAALLLIALVLT